MLCHQHIMPKTHSQDNFREARCLSLKDGQGLVVVPWRKLSNDVGYQLCTAIDANLDHVKYVERN